MALLSDIEGAAVVGDADVGLGTVSNVLFHPSEPRVVGIMIEPPAYARVVKRQPSYLGLDQFSVEKGRVRYPGKKLPGFSKGAQALGADPDVTVIWMGMPVVGPDDAQVGRVADADVDLSSGAILQVMVSAGVSADAAHGRIAVPAETLVGFERGAVKVSRTFGELEVSGGLAKTTATGAAVVAARASDVASKAGDAVVDAAGATGKAIRSVREGSATRKVKSTWSNMVDAYKEGRDEPD